MNAPFQLRPASESDFPFIWELRCLTMRKAVDEAYGWEEEIQRQYARESLSGQIVMTNSQDVGVLNLADWQDEVHIIWIAIYPEFQGKGLGRLLLRHCQSVASAAGKPLTLQVLRNNPAAAIYTRYGFEVTDDSHRFKLCMEWVPKMR